MNENHKIDEVYGVAYAKWMELRQEEAPTFPPAQAMDQLVDALRAYFRTAQGKTATTGETK